MLSGLVDDVRVTLRGWRRAPVFSGAVLLTLALGVGLLSAVLSFADGYLFRPLPFPGADRTYYVSDPQAPIASALSAADVEALRQSPVADFGFVEWSLHTDLTQLTVDDRSIEVFPFEVGRGFRTTLALPLEAGRDFTEDDHAAGGTVAAWLSHRFWQREFNGDRAVVGRTFRAQGPAGRVDVQVVGILNRAVSTFDLNNRPPDIVFAAKGMPPVGPNVLAFPLVLLPEGVSVEQATTRIASTLQAAVPRSNGKPRTVELSSFTEDQQAGGRPTAKMLFAGALLVFVLAAMNLTHLLLGRGAMRSAEVATRVALGASRWRVVRAFLVESALIGAVGTSAGLLLGQMLSSFLDSRVPQLPTGARNLSMVPMIFDGRIVAISVALGLLAALVGGLWPARQAWRGALLVRTGTQHVVSRGLARLILGSELTVVTVVAVGVVFASLGVYRYLHQPLGYDYVDRARVTVQVPGRRLTPAELTGALEAVRGVAGVRAAGLESARAPQQEIVAGDRTFKANEVDALGIAPGLFEAWGMKLRAGRWFEGVDFAGGDAVVVDERFARLAWPDRTAIGQSVRLGGVPRAVVGVLESQRRRLDLDPPPAILIPVALSAGRAPVVAWAPRVPIGDLRARVTSAVTAVVPGSRVIVGDTAFDTLFARGVGEARFQIPFVVAFGLLSGLLALVGVFGIVSFVVLQRTREFGIRVALGARRVDIRRTVLREAIGPAVIGLILGSVAARTLATLVESTIFGWKAGGLETIALVVFAILAVAVIAALAPASRAARTDPAISLRDN